MFGFGRWEHRAGPRLPDSFDNADVEAPIHSPSREAEFARKVLDIVRDAQFEAEAGPGHCLLVTLPEELTPPPDATLVRTEMSLADRNPEFLVLDTAECDDSSVAEVQFTDEAEHIYFSAD